MRAYNRLFHNFNLLEYIYPILYYSPQFLLTSALEFPNA